MKIKKKDMNKAGWNRVVKKEYISESFNIFNKYDGIISLSILNKVTEPLIIHYDFKDILIADNNYKWLQIAIKNQNFWLTVMYDDKDNLIQLYFDITKENHFEDINNPYFYDLFLDIVVTNTGEIHIIDKFELDEALEKNIITKKEYNLAIEVSQNLYNYLLINKDKVISDCNNYLNKLKSKLKLSIK